MVRVDAHLGGVRWEGSFDVDRREHGNTRSRPGPTCSAPGATSSSARSPRSSMTWPASSRKASNSSPPQQAKPRPSRTGADRARHRHSVRPGRARDGQARRGARPGAVRHPRAHPAPTRRRSASTAPLTIEVDRPLAKFGAWYELFPRSWGGLNGVETPASETGRARLRRALPPADPPDRPHQPQGSRQLPDRRPRRSRLALGDRRRRAAATTRSTPTSARSRT